jgi:hypothetical protein
VAREVVWWWQKEPLHMQGASDEPLIFARGFREAHVLLSWHVVSL